MLSREVKAFPIPFTERETSLAIMAAPSGLVFWSWLITATVASFQSQKTQDFYSDFNAQTPFCCSTRAEHCVAGSSVNDSVITWLWQDHEPSGSDSLSFFSQPESSRAARERLPHTRSETGRYSTLRQHTSIRSACLNEPDKVYLHDGNESVLKSPRFSRGDKNSTRGETKSETTWPQMMLQPSEDSHAPTPRDVDPS